MAKEIVEVHRACGKSLDTESGVDRYWAIPPTWITMTSGKLFISFDPNADFEEEKTKLKEVLELYLKIVEKDVLDAEAKHNLKIYWRVRDRGFRDIDEEYCPHCKCGLYGSELDYFEEKEDKEGWHCIYCGYKFYEKGRPDD